METPILTKQIQVRLLRIARETIALCFDKGTPQGHTKTTQEDCFRRQLKKYEPLNLPLLKETKSCFVSLHTFREGHKTLCGCIGTLEPRKGESLLENLISNSLAAAFNDFRFDPLQAEELDLIKIEISILTLPVSIRFDNPDQLFKQIKKKGVVLQSRYHRATFLPQVWEQIPDPELFCKHLARKAGLPADGYLSAMYQIYEVYSFEEA